MALQEPQLKGTMESRTSNETFRRRLSYYITGLLIGVVLVAMMLWARSQWQQGQGQGSGALEQGQQQPAQP